MPPPPIRDDSMIGLVFLALGVVFLLWVIVFSRRNQKANVDRVERAMAQNRENAVTLRETMETVRRTLEVAEQQLAAQDETNHLLERLIESSRRDRP